MFYPLLKMYGRLAIRIYCTRIRINRPEMLNLPGPLLLACNHPNSFLDGMILTTLFEHPVHALARGDAFKNKWMNLFLRSIRLLPVYRTSEGVENLGANYVSFAACQQSFEKKEIVLIFSEGRCENEWHLRELKKGTARLAMAAWKNGLPLVVVPTAINYSSFKKFGKEVHIYFGTPVNGSGVLSQKTEGRQHLAFNSQLRSQLKEMVYEIGPGDETERKRRFGIRIKPSFYFLLLPALAGWALHAPLFYTCRLLTSWRFRSSVHYDSILTALLAVTYPFYLVALVVLSGQFVGAYAWLFVFVSPLTAWACVQAKYQADL